MKRYKAAGHGHGIASAADGPFMDLPYACG
jgi:hypothetical protein